jgi:hypothetical protein
MIPNPVRTAAAALLVSWLITGPASADSMGLPGWPQPGGPGTPLVLTYSYSNLFDGGFTLLTGQELRAATEEALGLWSSHAPLVFVERPDSGPPPADTPYAGNGHPQIRIGHHDMLDLGHAFFPSVGDGRAGDVHIGGMLPWALSAGSWNFLEVVTHELGHALGLPHIDDHFSMMNSFFAMPRFGGLGSGFLLPPEMAALQVLYGAGAGAVIPLDPVPEPATLLLTATGLAILARGAIRRRSAPAGR